MAKRGKNLLVFAGLVGAGAYALHKMGGGGGGGGRGGVARGDAPHYTVSTPLIYPYDQSEDVRTLQKALNYLGYIAGPEDGIFGPQTAEALEAFQRDARIDPDKVAGPQTYNALNLALQEMGGSFRGPGM